MLYEALRRVLPNPSDAPLLLVFSKWRNTMATQSIISLQKKHREEGSAKFKNICDWYKCIHKLIMEVARWDHVVYKEVCSRSVITKTVRVLVIWKDDDLLRKLLQSISRAGTDQDTVPKTTEFASSVHYSILRSRKGMNCHWWYVFGPEHRGSVLVYNAGCQGIPRIFFVQIELKEIFDSVGTIL